MCSPPQDLSLLFVRHAATAWTAAARYQGRRDPPLSAEGQREAAGLAERLRDMPITLVLSSPLVRARDTAAAIAAATGARLTVDARLIELAYGEWEGLTQGEVKAAWPEELRGWKRSPHTARPPGGEWLAEVQTRLDDLLADLQRRTAAGCVMALVSHDIVIRLALLAGAGAGHEGLRGLSVPPASAYPARLRAGRLLFPPIEHAANV